MNIKYPAFYDNIIAAPHTLIAGTTGSGKSVALNGLLYALSAKDPARSQWVLIDPKRVELAHLKGMPHCIAYAASYTDITRILARVHGEMLSRYDYMARYGLRDYPGPEWYIIIDEWVDIKLFCPADTIKTVNHISSLARAAKIHLILCTQRPTKDTLTPLLKDNLPCKLALATESPQQSKYLVDSPAAYGLPIGSGLFYTPKRPGEWQRVKIDLISPEKWQAVYNYRLPQKTRQNGILSRLKAIIT